MSTMIQCDGCKYTMYDDSRSEKGDYHEIWIDRSHQYHLCRNCYNTFMSDILRRKWCDKHSEFIQQDECPDVGIYDCYLCNVR